MTPILDAWRKPARSLAPIVALASVILFVTQPARSAYFHSDDYEYLDRRVEPRTVFLANKDGLTGVGGRYRPIPLLSILADRSLWGLDPAGYNATNAGLHLICTVAVLALANTLFPGNALRSFLAALLFSVQPVFTDTIFWISARPDSLCGVFYLLSIVLFVRSVRAPSRGGVTKVLSLASFVLAMMSKEMAVTLPGIVWLIDAAGLARKDPGGGCTRVVAPGRRSPQAERMMQATRASMPYAALLGAYLGFRYVILGSIAGGTGNMNFATGRVLANIERAMSFMTFPSSRFDLVMAAVLVAFLSFRRLRACLLRRDVLFGVLWIAVTLVPVLGLITRWYLYIPSIGLCLALAGVATAAPTESVILRRSLVVGLVIMVGVHALLLRREARLWTESGEVVRTIVRDVHERGGNTGERYVINVPAGILDDGTLGMGEKPVFAYNLEKAVNITWGSTLRVIPVTTIFLRGGVDPGAEIAQLGDLRLRVTLDEKRSRFSYHSAEFLSGAVVPMPGLAVPDARFDLTLGASTQEVIVDFKRPVLPGEMLVFSNGRVVPLTGPAVR